MSERIKKLEQLKALAALIHAGQEAQLASARQSERATQGEIASLRHARQAEMDGLADAQGAAAIEAWLGWSRAQIGAAQSKQALQRAEVETRLAVFRKTFGRSAAIDDLLEKERLAQRQKQTRA
ncbi:MAG: hypothetical protein AAFQ32_07840 [Pseudomonadota bacterium]